MKTPSTPSEPPTKFRWFNGKTPYTNNSGNWIVIAGCAVPSAAGVGDGGLIIAVEDQDGNIVDELVMSKSTAAGFETTMMSRRMLVPPGGQFVMNIGFVPVQFSGIQCLTLEDALVIL